MRFISSLAAQLRWLSIALLLVCAADAFGADSYSAGRLTIPTLVIGNATYSNVVVNVGSILSGPAGSVPVGTVDTYNPANGQLTVQAVTLGSLTAYNVVVTVSSLVSIGSVSGADTYDGHTVTAAIFLSFTTYLSNVAFTPTGAPSIAGGMPAALYDTLNGTTLSIPALEYAGHVFTNISVPATQGSATASNQTIAFSKPVYSIYPLKVGASEAILATATSGLPVSYVVTTPSICTVVQSSAQQGYGYINYSAAGGSGSGVVGAAPLGGGAYQANTFTGLTSDGQPLGLALASSVLNPYPATEMYYTPPYPNFVLDGNAQGTAGFFYDDVFFANGGPVVDIAGIVLQAPGDPIINILYQSGTGYLYADSIIFNAGGPYQSMTFSAAVVNGLVGLSDGACVITAFQPGGGSFSAAAPASITVDVGVTILP
jgi:hypothetical protein